MHRRCRGSSTSEPARRAASVISSPPCSARLAESRLSNMSTCRRRSAASINISRKPRSKICAGQATTPASPRSRRGRIAMSRSSSTRPTTRKVRFVSEHHSTHLLRADWELAQALNPKTEKALVDRTLAALPRAASVVLSDYAKGTLTPRVIQEVIHAAKKAKIPIIVDPKAIDYSIYRGATVIKPNRKELAERLAEWRGLRIGFTNGCFDLLHPGHIKLLSEAHAACDRLIVGLNDDASVRRLKGEGRPLQAVHARAEVLAALEAVDLVVVFEQDTPLELIREVKPTVLVKGGDYKPDQVVGREVVKAQGGEVIVVDLVPGFSTTRIVEKSRGRKKR